MSSTTSGSKKGPQITVRTREGSEDSIQPVRSPRTPRFAEATSVNSPIEAPTAGPRFPESHTPTESFQPQLQPGDVGFGYIKNDRRSMQNVPHIELPGGEVPLTPGPKSPLKSAMKSPGIKSRNIGDLPLKSPMFQDEMIKSPTWREEKLLEKRETRTDRRQADDLRVKVRVRMAKLVLRFTNFSCSLIVLAMLTTTLNIFNASKDLPPRNNLPPWAPNTPRWPQLTVLVISCVSLFFSVMVLIAYWRKGKKRAEKWAAYYSIIAIGWFMASIIMWAIGAGIFQHAKHTGDGKDMWGWSCKSNTRQKIFQSDVNYELLCRLQNWSLVCCIIEVVVEVITILVYGIIFYRFWSKRKLTKTMAKRDAARSQLYMSQLNSPSGANFPTSPGVPLSPGSGGYNPMYSPRFAPGADAAEKGQAQSGVGSGMQFSSLAGALAPPPEKFTLSKAPVKSPKTGFKGFATSPTTTASSTDVSPITPSEAQKESFTAPSAKPKQVTVTVNERVAAAPGEQQYGEVPIPGAYASPVQSPNLAPPQTFGSLR